MDPSIYTWTPRDIPESQESISPKALEIITQAISGMIQDLKDYQMVSDEKTDEDTYLRQVDHELARLRSIMWATREEFSKRVSAIANRRNSLVPFNSLPMELAGSILGSSLSADPFSSANTQSGSLQRLKDLASVSSGYYQIVKSCPALWTTIPLHLASVASLKLRKSGGHPLIIMGEEYEETLSLVTPHCHRWRSADIEFNTPGELTHVGRLLLGERRQWLESVKLRFSRDCRDSEHWPNRSQKGSPLKVASSDILRHLEVEGVMLNVCGMLRNLRHLEVHAVTGVRTAELVSLISSTPELRSLILHQVGVEREVETDIGPQLGVDLPALTVFEMSDVSSSLCLAILKGMSGGKLSTLRVGCSYRQEDDSPTLRMLLHPHGEHSMMSAAIANSGVDALSIMIKNDEVLEVEGYFESDEAEVEVEPLIKFEGLALFDETPGWGWTRSLSSFPDFANFAASLPPTKLRFTGGIETGRDWSFEFLISMPSVTSILLSKPTESALYLFEGILAKPHRVGAEWVWACPKLVKIEFDSSGNHDWTKLVPRAEKSLATRQMDGAAARLPLISWSFYGYDTDSQPSEY